MAPSRPFLLACLAALAATETALRAAALVAHPEAVAALRGPGVVALALAFGAVGWIAFRAAARPLHPRPAAALAAVLAASLAAGAVRQLPHAVAADAQWGFSGSVVLAPVDRWRPEPRRWRALVVGDCGITSVVEVERRGGRAVLTERFDFGDSAFFLAYALGGWRRLPATRRTVPALDRDPGAHRPPEAQGRVLVEDGAGARLLWR